jgi:hypothetical protein
MCDETEGSVAGTRCWLDETSNVMELAAITLEPLCDGRRSTTTTLIELSSTQAGKESGHIIKCVGI